jgi:hypothetical protein
MKDFDAKIAMLSDRNTHLLNELRDAKDTIFKLQTITLETSQKMMKMVMAKSVPEVVSAPSSSVEMQDDVDEGLELEETPAMEDEMVGEEMGEENVSLQVEGQSA